MGKQALLPALLVLLCLHTPTATGAEHYENEKFDLSFDLPAGCVVDETVFSAGLILKVFHINGALIRAQYRRCRTQRCSFL